MMTALTSSCVVLALCLGLLRSDGELLSESGTSQDKSCEQEGQVKGHDDSANQRKVLVSGADNGQTRLWMGRYLMSDLREEETGQDGREASSVLKENLRQKWQTMVRQQRKVETLPELNQRRQHQLQPDDTTDRIQTTEHAPQPPTRRVYSLGRQNGANRNRDPIRQETNTNNEPSKVQTSVSNGKTHVSTEPFRSATINVRKDRSPPRKEHTRRPHLRHILTSTIQPNLRGDHQDRTDTTMAVPIKRRNSQVTFVTQSSMIYPFIATTRAYNFLTSYDSWPLPTRWPIKMILPERDRSASQEIKSVSSKKENEGEAVLSGENDAPHPGCNQQSLQPVQPNKGDEDRLNIKPMSSLLLSEVHDGQETRPTTDPRDRSCIEDARVNAPYSASQTQTPTTLNGHTHDVDVNSDQATGNTRDKSGDEKNKKKKKRKNKLRKQRKRRKQKKKEMGTTATAPDQRDETYPLGPALADSDTMSDSHSVAVKDGVVSLVTDVKYGHTTDAGFPAPGKQGVGDTFLHPHEDNGPSNVGKHQHLIYEETTKRTDYGGRNSHPNVVTTQPPQQLFKTTAQKDKLKSQTGGRSNKLSRFSDTFSNRKNNDNQMPTSRRYDSSTTPSLVLFNKHSCPETDLPQRCAEAITNDSPDNTEQHMQQHLEDHTDSDLQRQRASPVDRQSVPKVIHNNNVKKKEDSARRSFSPLPLTQASKRELVTRKTNAYNRVTSYPTTTNTYTETTPLHLLPSNIHLSELSSARQWRERMKERQSQSHRVPKENTPTINSGSPDSKPVKRKGSLGSAPSMSKSQTTPPDSSNVDLDKKESGPFIGYKSAYDFLSNQKGINSHFQNEARREANEMNRYMAEGMCRIFGKRYVPTRIGGKCV